MYLCFSNIIHLETKDVNSKSNIITNTSKESTFKYTFIYMLLYYVLYLASNKAFIVNISYSLSQLILSNLEYLIPMLATQYTLNSLINGHSKRQTPLISGQIYTFPDFAKAF